MRIGFDAKRAFHNSRGLGNYSRDLITGLSKYYSSHEYFLFTPPVEMGENTRWAKDYNNLRIITPQTFLAKKFSSLWRSFSLKDEISKYELDIFHGLSHELPVGISNSNCKSVVTIHDLIFLRFPEFFPFIDRKVYLKKFTYACDHADTVIAICEQTKRDLIEFLGVREDKIEVVYQTCNPRFYTLWEDSKRKETLSKYNIKKDFILTVGAIEQRKNVLSLVKAYASLKKEINVDLVIVGKGKAYKEQVQNYIKSKGLESRVHILENVSHFDLPAFYQEAKLFCYPSHFEGFGIPIIEALFSKTPVITSRGSCFPEAGGPNSIYIDPESVGEISDAIVSVLTDEDKSYQMAEMGRNYVEKFHRSKTSENLFQIYNKLLSQ